jgi:hypothetical protein
MWFDYPFLSGNLLRSSLRLMAGSVIIILLMAFVVLFLVV